MISINKILKNNRTSIFYTFSSITKAFAQMSIGLATAKFVSPNDFGIWTSLNLLLTYSVLFQFGVNNGLNLELPLAAGRNNSTRMDRMVGTAQTFLIFVIALIILIGVLYFTFIPPEDPKIYYGILGVGVLIIFTFYQNLLTATFRSKSSFFTLSKIELFHAIFNILTIFFIIYYSYYGLILKSVLLLIVYVSVLHYNRPIKTKLLWNKNIFLRLIKVGIPIFILSYFQLIGVNMDKMLLIKFSTLENVGIYSFGFLAFTTIKLISTPMATYFYPIMSSMFSSNSNVIHLWNYVIKITLATLILLLFLSIIASLLTPFIIQNYFQNYEDAIPLMKVLFFAGAFNGGTIGVNALYSMKKWKYVTIYHIIFCVLLFIFPFLGLYIFNDKLLGISYGVLIANFLNFISGIVLIFIATHKQSIT